MAGNCTDRFGITVVGGGGGGGGPPPPPGRAGFFSSQERCRFHFVYASIKMHHSSDKNIQKGIIMTQDRIYSEESSCP